MNERLRKIHEQGRCSDSGSHHLFFSESPAELAAAQTICGGCPVRFDCLELALMERHEWGVWGGVIFWDGIPYHRRRGRGRPRRGEGQSPVEAEVDQLWEVVKTA